MGKSKKREYKIKQINQSNNDESVKKCASKTRKTIKNKTRTKYTKEAVERALKAVSAGISVRKTSDTFGVPATTIFRKYKSPELLTCKMSSPTILTAAEEEDIVKWLIYKAQIGCPVTKTELLDNVQFYLKLMKKKTPFTNDRPGRHWYEAFCKRNPDIRIRTAQNLTLVRASIFEEELRNWLSEIKTYLESKNLLDVEPSSSFNCCFKNFKMRKQVVCGLATSKKKGLFEYWLGIKHKNHDEIKAHVNENNSSKPVIKMIQNLDNQYILNNGRILLPLTEQYNLKCLEENLMDNARSQNVIDNKTEFENSNVNENSAVESTNALMPISPDQLFELPVSLVHPAQENIQDIENNNIIMIEDLSNLSSYIGEISLTSYNSYVSNILKPRNSLNNQNISCKAKTFEITAAIPETQESEIESLRSTCEGNISFVADKENDKTFANKNAQVTDPESFSKAFTLPEQYLTKKKRDIIMKCNKPKLPSAGTSDDWLKIQEQIEKEKRLKEEQKEKKKQLQEEKKKIAEEKKKLDAKIKEIQTKIKTEKL